MLVIDVSLAVDLNWIQEIRFSSNVFLQLKYGHCCGFFPNHMAEFGFFGKKSSGILFISKGIPSLANEGARLNIVQSGLRRKERRLYGTKIQRRTCMSIKSKHERHWI